MLATIAALIAIPALAQTPDQYPLLKRLKPQSSMADDVRDFYVHRTGTDTKVRLAGYEARLRMEREGFLGGLKWRCVGPEVQSGRVIRILPNSQEPGSLYVAFATGGVFRTLDNGQTWNPVFEGQSSFGVGDMAISRKGTIWIGTGEHNSQRTSYQGTGVFKSTDRGATWQYMGLADTNHIGAIEINPKDENEVFVAALGHLYTANLERGVYRSRDGGKSWKKVLYVNDITGFVDMAMDPANPKTIYVSAWERERRAWDFRDAGPSTAVYKSTDGGDTWVKLSGGLPSGDIGRIGLAVAPSKPNIVYAFIDNFNSDPDTVYDDEYAPSGTLTAYRFLFMNEAQFSQLPKETLDRFVTRYMPTGTKGDELRQKVRDGQMTLVQIAEMMERRNANVFAMERVTHEIYRSEDYGKTWRRTHAYRFGVHGGYYFGEVRVNPRDPNDLWTLGTILLRSKDGGKSWTREAPGVHVDFHDLYIDPSNPKRLVVGCDGGPYASENDGISWRHWNNLPVGQTTTLAVDNKIPYNIYVGLQDNGTLVGPSTYVAGRSPVTNWKQIGGGDGSWIAVDPRDDGDLVYIASQFGAHSAINQKTNERWNAAPTRGQGGPPLRYNWISPLIISPHHPDIVYLGSQFVHRSFAKGRNYQVISPDLTKNRKQGDVPHSTIKVLDESPLKFGLIYAGTDDGRVQMTPDAGNTWIDISTPEPDKWVSRVLASKYDVDTVYVTQTGYRDDDYNPYVWKSTDRGKSWKSIAGDLPTEFINSIKEDPVKQGWLYVATGMGVFMSMDGGSHWEPVGGNLPRCAVHDIVIHPRDLDLVAATHGKSVWVISLKQIHTIDDAMLKTPIKVMDIPSMAAADWAMRRRQEWDASPGDPPTVSGWFWVNASGTATLRLKDKDGNVVKESKFEAVRGLQQWSLDLMLKPPGDKYSIDNKKRPRNTLEEILADPFASMRGEFVKPGTYTVEISVGALVGKAEFRLIG